MEGGIGYPHPVSLQHRVPPCTGPRIASAAPYCGASPIWSGSKRTRCPPRWDHNYVLLCNPWVDAPMFPVNHVFLSTLSPPSCVSVHLHSQSLPFSSGPDAKAKIAAGIIIFFGGGFSIPFIAAKWTIRKNGREPTWFGPPSPPATPPRRLLHRRRVHHVRPL